MSIWCESERYGRGLQDVDADKRWQTIVSGYEGADYERMIHRNGGQCLSRGEKSCIQHRTAMLVESLQQVETRVNILVHLQIFVTAATDNKTCVVVCIGSYTSDLCFVRFYVG